MRLGSVEISGVGLGVVVVPGDGQGDGVGELLEVVGAGDVLDAELFEVGVHELGIEQDVAASSEVFDEFDEAGLGGVGLPAEHGLAEERAADADAVESADESAVLPGFDGVCVSASVELGVDADDGGGDPGVGGVRAGLGAVFDDVAEGVIEGVGVAGVSDAFGQGASDFEAVVEGEDGAGVGAEPVDALAASPAGHGEQSDAVGVQEGVGGEGGLRRRGHGV